MIKLELTITGKCADAERNTVGDVRHKINNLNSGLPHAVISMKTVEETVPLTLELAARRVVGAWTPDADVSGYLDDLRRVLAGEYVCVPKESEARHD